MSQHRYTSYVIFYDVLAKSQAACSQREAAQYIRDGRHMSGLVSIWECATDNVRYIVYDCCKPDAGSYYVAPAFHTSGVPGDSCNTSTPNQPGRTSSPSYRPAVPIQRLNNKTISWPAWFCHFKVVADVHGWDKDQ